ncbi:Schizosaccharomyces specific protein [Schizosaccharomyces osmophilus]|uniref:Schizosaccharomyces specific protein n=1 Tax=Schizosaccharomyces osmophilus TaxID=2545709 RepID=A0AAE9W629_9SCHI|nr:Schizosaccharomyces specific protein [Schizosaccharomyces osmophilus]WBW70694.1 Schizosaccharomyces specific protein [Schizosaccharomyces osmophilus]
MFRRNTLTPGKGGSSLDMFSANDFMTWIDGMKHNSYENGCSPFSFRPIHESSQKKPRRPSRLSIVNIWNQSPTTARGMLFPLDSDQNEEDMDEIVEVDNDVNDYKTEQDITIDQKNHELYEDEDEEYEKEDAQQLNQEHILSDDNDEVLEQESLYEKSEDELENENQQLENGFYVSGTNQKDNPEVIEIESEEGEQNQHYLSDSNEQLSPLPEEQNTEIQLRNALEPNRSDNLNSHTSQSSLHTGASSHPKLVRLSYEKNGFFDHPNQHSESTKIESENPFKTDPSFIRPRLDHVIRSPSSVNPLIKANRGVRDGLLKYNLENTETDESYTELDDTFSRMKQDTLNKLNEEASELLDELNDSDVFQKILKNDTEPSVYDTSGVAEEIQQIDDSSQFVSFLEDTQLVSSNNLQPTKRKLSELMENISSPDCSMADASAILESADFLSSNPIMSTIPNKKRHLE